MAAETPERATKEVFDLFKKYGDRDYIGEPVSQEEHMIQCAMLAEKDGYSDEVILGVFLHDIALDTWLGSIEIFRQWRMWVQMHMRL